MDGQERITICIPETDFRRVVRFSNQAINSALAYYRKDREMTPAQLAKKDKWESMLIKVDLMCKRPKEKPGCVEITLPRETLAYAFRAYNTPDSQKAMKDKYTPLDFNDFIVETAVETPKQPERVLRPVEPVVIREEINLFSPLDVPSRSSVSPVIDTPINSGTTSPVPSGQKSIIDILAELGQTTRLDTDDREVTEHQPEIYTPNARKISSARVSREVKLEAQPVSDDSRSKQPVYQMRRQRKQTAKKYPVRNVILQVVPTGAK